MADLTAERIVAEAIAADDLYGLLVAKPKYRYIPKGSPAPGQTDLIVLLDALYEAHRVSDRSELRSAYQVALRRALLSYNGIPAVAYALFLEAFRKAKGRSTMDIGSADLAKALRSAIDFHREEFASDFSGPGSGWANGWLGEFGRLSEQSQKYGGPALV